MRNQYYDSKLGIDGTAEDLARFGTQYADDYSDEALEKIISILTAENMQIEAARVEYELESRKELRDGKRDLGRLKLNAMDKMYWLINEEDNDAFYLTCTRMNDQVVVSVTGKPDEDGIVRENTAAISLKEFYAMSAKEFDRFVNAAWFYAIENGDDQDCLEEDSNATINPDKDTVEHVQFVSYDGRWPWLCKGHLILDIDGTSYVFGNDDDNLPKFWKSGGDCGFAGSDYPKPYTDTDKWEIDAAKLPEELRKYAKEIDRVFNDNVEYGCCGGCL